MSHRRSPGAWVGVGWFVLLGVWAPYAAWGEPVTTIRDHGHPGNRVDLVILGDGYTASELTKYADDVEAFVQGLFAQEPFQEYQQYFNVHRVDVVSEESGADHPERNIFRNTALGAEYNCAGIQRLICVDLSRVNTVLLSSLSADRRDIVLVIVNDAEYGGSGGSVAVASVNPAVIELVLHELGHSFGLLADEYGGPPPPSCVASFEPVEVNATRETLREQVKWNHWISADTPVPTLIDMEVPGLYEGARYCDAGLFRPTFASKMRSLARPFEQINSEQLIKRTYNWVSPIDSSEPADDVMTIGQGETRLFTVVTPSPLTQTLDVTWRVDGQAVAAGTAFTLSSSTLTPGQHTVEVEVRDATPMVRFDPAGVLSERRTWVLTVNEAGPSLARFRINGGAQSTTSATVTLNHTATGAPTEYRASESPTFADAVWQPYATAPSFTLSAEAGIKRVYFQVRNAARESSVLDDTITARGAALTTFRLNDGAANTTSPTVILSHTATGQPTEYRASESSSFAGAEWQPYTPAPRFTLSAGSGAKQVYFQVRNAVAASGARRDSIIVLPSQAGAPASEGFEPPTGLSADRSGRAALMPQK